MLKVDILAWKKQIEFNSQKVITASERTFKRSAELLKQRVMEYTPIGNPSLWRYPAHKDYTPGHLKSNWKLSFNGREIDLSNDAPYALAIENGWSHQAPNGMLRRAWMDYPRLLEQAAEENKL